MPATYYPAIVDRSASGFGVTFPDFPGCIANGATVNEAALNAEGALSLHVEAMVKDKDPLPEPSALDAIDPVEGSDDVATLLVRVDTPVKVERVLLSLDSNLIRAIDAVAPNRSAFMAAAARSHLAGAHRFGERTRHLLSQFGAVQLYLTAMIEGGETAIDRARGAVERLREDDWLVAQSGNLLNDVAAAADGVVKAIREDHPDHGRLNKAREVCHRLEFVAGFHFYNAVLANA